MVAVVLFFAFVGACRVVASDVPEEVPNSYDSVSGGAQNYNLLTPGDMAGMEDLPSESTVQGTAREEDVEEDPKPVSSEFGRLTAARSPGANVRPTHKVIRITLGDFVAVALLHYLSRRARAASRRAWFTRESASDATAYAAAADGLSDAALVSAFVCAGAAARVVLNRFVEKRKQQAHAKAMLHERIAERASIAASGTRTREQDKAGSAEPRHGAVEEDLRHANRLRPRGRRSRRLPKYGLPVASLVLGLAALTGARGIKRRNLPPSNYHQVEENASRLWTSTGLMGIAVAALASSISQFSRLRESRRTTGRP